MSIKPSDVAGLRPADANEQKFTDYYGFAVDDAARLYKQMLREVAGVYRPATGEDRIAAAILVHGVLSLPEVEDEDGVL